MVLVVGLTFTVKLDPVPLKAVPSDKVPLNVPVPTLGVIVKVAVPPLQIAVVPLSVARGVAFMVTLAVV